MCYTMQTLIAHSALKFQQHGLARLLIHNVLTNAFTILKPLIHPTANPQRLMKGSFTIVTLIKIYTPKA